MSDPSTLNWILKQICAEDRVGYVRNSTFIKLVTFLLFSTEIVLVREKDSKSDQRKAI